MIITKKNTNKILFVLFLVFIIIPLASSSITQISTTFIINVSTATNEITYEINELNSTNTSENFTYDTGGGSQLVYITIPQNSNVTNAEWNISGIGDITNSFESDFEDWTNESDSSGAVIRSTDWASDGSTSISGTENNCEVCPAVAHLYKNITFSNNSLLIFDLNLTSINVSGLVVYQCTSSDCTGAQARTQIYNQTTTGELLNEQVSLNTNLGAVIEFNWGNQDPFLVGEETSAVGFIDNVRINMTPPNNVTIDSGDDGTNDFTGSGNLTTETNIDLNFTALNNFISTCTTGNNDNCNVTFNVSSDQASILQITAINITYDYNISTLFNITDNTSLKDGYWDINNSVNNGSNDVNITGYYVSASATRCRINSTLFTVTGSPEYCPFTDNITQGSQWTDYRLRDNIVDTGPSDINIQNDTLTNNSNSANNWVYLNFSVNETLIDSCLAQYNNGSATNYTMTIEALGCSVNLTSQTDGDWNYTIFANDSLESLGSNGTFFVTVDTTAPTIFINPAGNTVGFISLDQVHRFEVDVTDSTTGIDSVYLEFDSTNYTATFQSGDTYAVELTSLAVGSYNYRWWSNDTINNLASSSQFTYTITTEGGGGGGGSGQPVCGNGFCEIFESEESCPQDCIVAIPEFSFGVLPASGIIGRFVSANATYTEQVSILNPNAENISVSIFITCESGDPSCDWLWVIDQNGTQFKILNLILTGGTSISPGREDITVIMITPPDIEITGYRALINFKSIGQQKIVAFELVTFRGFGIFDYFRELLETTIYDLRGIEIKIWMIVLPIVLITIFASVKLIRKKKKPKFIRSFYQ